jgi:hypothetical protein
MTFQTKEQFTELSQAIGELGGVICAYMEFAERNELEAKDVAAIYAMWERVDTKAEAIRETLGGGAQWSHQLMTSL